MKARWRENREVTRDRPILLYFAFPPLIRVAPALFWTLVLCTLSSQSNCRAYTFPEQTDYYHGSLPSARPTASHDQYPSGSLLPVRNPSAPELRRGTSGLVKRGQEQGRGMLLNGWSSSPSDGFSPATTPGMWDRLKAATGRTKQAEQQVGMYGWSDDLRRHTTLVFDREQLMRADRLTGVPPALEAIKRISSPSLAPVVPGGGMQPDFQAYEIWVADLLGL